MPFLLVRDGKIVVQDTRLARESCTQCCEGSEPLWFEVADCCFPDETFWLQVGQLGRNGEVLYTPGVPVTIRSGPYCATTRPDVALTYDEVIALDPDADFRLYAGQGPEVVPAGCDDPVCQPCPQCCVVRHISDNECGGPACCEHGGTFTVNIGVTKTYQEFRRVYGWNASEPFCLECFRYSGEVQSVSGSSSYFISVRFTCDSNGRYTGVCTGARQSRQLLNWDVTGPVGHSCGLQDGFAPIRTELPINADLDDGCAEMFSPSEPASTWFNKGWFNAANAAPSLGHIDQLFAGGLVFFPDRFGRDCFGSDNTFEVIDRSWTSDSCEQILAGAGNVRSVTKEWNGNQSCDGGSFLYNGEYEAGFTTRFFALPASGWQPWVSRAIYRVEAVWSIERSGRPTCLEPQCVGNPGGLPPLLFDRRAAVPAVKQSEARKGCSSCGKGEGL
jgi:hypothetical protein